MDMLNNTVITWYGDRLLLDSLRWLFCNVCKYTMLLADTNILYVNLFNF